MAFEQAFVEELLLDLANLKRLHAASVGGDFLSALLAECGQGPFRCCCDEGIEEFFFEDREVAFEVFEVGCVFWRSGEDREAIGDF